MQQQSLAPKRQRRPSVRLGEIGDQPATLSYDSSHPRRPKTWRFHKDPTFAAKSSKVRPLTNLVNGGGVGSGAGVDYHETATLESEDNLDLRNRKSKSKRSVKRVRTNWTASRLNNGIEENNNSRYENNEVEFRDFEPQNSESPLKEQSPVHSADNVGLDYWRPLRTRVSESRDQDDGLPESNSRDRRCGTSNGGNFGGAGDRSRLLDDGVRDWLLGLGLGRYAPMFEIHEVDDEVLPMLTLEDLKDMGINAVGSRRKMYTSILKLRKGFS